MSQDINIRVSVEAKEKLKGVKSLTKKKNYSETILYLIEKLTGEKQS